MFQQSERYLRPSLQTSSSTSTDLLTEEESHGPLYALSKSICAICHLTSTAPSMDSQGNTDPVDPMTSTAFLASLRDDATNAGKEAFVPYETDCCGGLYCYYCIASAMLIWEKERQSRFEINDRKGKDTSICEGWKCLRCARPVQSIERWRGGDSGDAKPEDVAELEKT